MLLPAATENVITSENARPLDAKILCEGANGPTTSLADEILAEKKIFVIPDILANAGGVTVSYFEWVQDRQGFFWNEHWSTTAGGDHGRRLRRRGASSRTSTHVNNRTAAYMLALDRVAAPSSCGEFTPDVQLTPPRR